MDIRDALHLRPATMDDAKILFAWRNDNETRRNSRNQAEITWENHHAWLTKKLGQDKGSCWLYIVEDYGKAIGTVRADRLKDEIELSWTVAPEFRGRGYSQKMVLQFIDEVLPNEKIKATIEEKNKASEKIAEALGLFKVKREFDENDSRSFWIWR